MINLSLTKYEQNMKNRDFSRNLVEASDDIKTLVVMAQAYSDNKDGEFKLDEWQELNFNDRFNFSAETKNSLENPVDTLRASILGEMGISYSKDKKIPKDLLFAKAKKNTDILMKYLDIMIQKNIGLPNIPQEYYETIFIDWGEPITIKPEEDSILNVSKIDGWNWNATRQRVMKKEAVPVKTEFKGIHVYEDYLEFLMGRITMSDLYRKIEKAFDTDKILAVSAVLGDVSGLAKYTDNGNSYDDFITLADTVATSNEKDVVLVSSLSAFRRVSKGLDFSDEMLNRMNNEGVLPRVGGYEYLVLNTKGGLDEDKVMMIPVGEDRAFIKHIIEGERLTNEISDFTKNQEMTLSVEVHEKSATIAVLNNAFGVYTVTGNFQ